MNKIARLASVTSLVFCASLTGSLAAPQDVVSQDDASMGDYRSGWESDKGGGNGFGKWNLQVKQASEGESHAGFFTATPSQNKDLNGIVIGGKAFGCFANGTDYEATAAFRSFDRPLQVNQSFSFQMEGGQFVRKFETDSGDGGSYGVTLLNDVSGTTGTDDYNKGVRFEFGYYQEDGAYLVYDGDGKKKLDVPFTDAGLSATVTLTGPDTYNLEVTTLTNKKTFRFEKRKLGGTAGSKIGGFCLFDRNGETNDVFFNGLQVLQKP